MTFLNRFKMLKNKDFDISSGLRHFKLELNIHRQMDTWTMHITFKKTAFAILFLLSILLGNLNLVVWQFKLTELIVS